MNKFLENIDEFFPPDEGSMEQYYGRIGQGKTYAATKDALDDLKSGKVVYANWPIKWEGYDEKEDKSVILLSLIFPFIKNFINYPKENFHYFPVDENFVNNISRLTDCVIYLDEGHLAFDSYEMAKMGIQKRAAVLHTRHFNRTIKIISQRPTAIHVTLRANVNRFYKCEKIFKIGKFILFRKSEFQDLDGDDRPIETEPISTKYYFSSKKVFEAYDSKFMRGNTPSSQKNMAEIWNLTYGERFKMLVPSRKKETASPTFSDLEKTFSLKVEEEPAFVKIRKHDPGTCIDENCKLCPK